jgi:hypothetical protein
MTEAQIWTAAIVTIALWTFLYKDTIIYRIAEHTYVGLAAAWTVGNVFHNYVKPSVTDYILQRGQWDYLIPIVLGLLIYTRYMPGLTWLSRYPLSWWVGYGAGFVLAFQMRPFIGQITASFWALNSINNVLLFIGLIATLIYFFFTLKRENPIIGYGAEIGKWTIMVALGASFGSTVLYRITLFMGRANFILFDWLGL